MLESILRGAASARRLVTIHSFVLHIRYMYGRECRECRECEECMKCRGCQTAEVQNYCVLCMCIISFLSSDFGKSTMLYSAHQGCLNDDWMDGRMDEPMDEPMDEVLDKQRLVKDRLYVNFHDAVLANNWMLCHDRE